MGMFPVKHPGALHRALGVPIGKTIPVAAIRKAAGKGGRLGKMAREAQNMAKVRGK